MADINDLSVTDASNTARFPEGMARASVNNAARALEGILARWHKDNNGSLATGGTSTAITVTLNQSSIAAWYDGLTFAARITTTCGATPTINPTGSAALGAKSLYWSGTGTQLAANDLTSTSVATFMYEATSDKVYVFACPPTSTFALAARSLTAGAGLTGGGDLSSDRTFTVGAGTGILANADDVAVDKATQANMEAAASNKVVTADVQHFHPGMAKCWGQVTGGASPSLITSYNTTSIADTATGRLTVTIATDMGAADYCIVMSLLGDGGTQRNGCSYRTQATGSFELNSHTEASALQEALGYSWAVYGDM